MKSYYDEILEFEKAVHPFLFTPKKTDHWASSWIKCRDFPRNILTIKITLISPEFVEMFYEAWKDRLFFVTDVSDLDKEFILYVVMENLKVNADTYYNQNFNAWLGERGY